MHIWHHSVAGGLQAAVAVATGVRLGEEQGQLESTM
jgi:hypothetical protein